MDDKSAPRRRMDAPVLHKATILVAVAALALSLVPAAALMHPHQAQADPKAKTIICRVEPENPSRANFSFQVSGGGTYGDDDNNNDDEEENGNPLDDNALEDDEGSDAGVTSEKVFANIKNVKSYSWWVGDKEGTTDNGIISISSSTARTITVKAGSTEGAVKLHLKVTLKNGSVEYDEANYSTYTPLASSTLGVTTQAAKATRSATPNNDTEGSGGYVRKQYNKGEQVAITGKCGEKWRIQTNNTYGYIDRNKVSVPVTDVRLNMSETTLGRTQRTYFVATVLPTIADNRSVKWRCDDESGAVTVDEKGIVSANADIEQANIIAETNGKDINGNPKTAACKVEVSGEWRPVPLSLNSHSVNLIVGQTAQLRASGEVIDWRSSSGGIATAGANKNDRKQSTVKTYAPGTSVLTAISSGLLEDKATVTVAPPPKVNLQVGKPKRSSKTKKVTSGLKFGNVGWLGSAGASSGVEIQKGKLVYAKAVKVGGKKRKKGKVVSYKHKAKAKQKGACKIKKWAGVKTLQSSQARKGSYKDTGKKGDTSAYEYRVRPYVKVRQANGSVATFYGAWSTEAAAAVGERTYNVTFHSNVPGRDETKIVSNIRYSQTITLDTKGFSRAGHVFKGWSLKPDDDLVIGTSGNQVPGTWKEGAKIQGLTTGTSINLYARWLDESEGNSDGQYRYLLVAGKGRTAAISRLDDFSSLFTMNGVKHNSEPVKFAAANASSLLDKIAEVGKDTTAADVLIFYIESNADYKYGDLVFADGENETRIAPVALRKTLDTFVSGKIALLVAADYSGVTEVNVSNNWNQTGDELGTLANWPLIENFDGADSEEKYSILSTTGGTPTLSIAPDCWYQGLTYNNTLHNAPADGAINSGSADGCVTVAELYAYSFAAIKTSSERFLDSLHRSPSEASLEQIYVGGNNDLVLYDFGRG